MGAYLSKPICDKESEDYAGDSMLVGASAMQGWRMSQEDAHCCLLDYDTDSSLFAVYDGHGGSEVAVYTAKKFPDFLKTVPAYKEGRLAAALEDAFLGFDATLVESDVKQELAQLATGDEPGIVKQPGDDEDEVEETKMLCDEASLPIEVVLERYYGSGLNKAVADLKKSTGKNLSPVVRGKPSPDGTVKVNEAGDAENKDDEVRVKLADSLVNGYSEDGEDDKSPSLPDVAQESGNHITSSMTASAGDKLPSISNECATSSNIDCFGTDGRNCAGVGREGSEAIAACDPKSDLQCIDTRQVSEPAASNSNVTELTSSGVSSTSISEPDVVGVSTTSKHEAEAEAVCSSSGCHSSNRLPAGCSSSTDAAGTGSVTEAAGSSGSAACGSSAASAAESSSACSSSGVGGCSAGTSSNKPADSSDEETTEEEVDSEDELDEWNAAEAGSDSEDDEDEDGEEGAEDDDEEEEDDDDDDDAEEMDPGMEMGDEPGADSGCTAVVALLRHNELFVANAGDSRCVLCRDGKAVEMSVDHKPEDAIEHDRITKAGGRVTCDGRVNGGLNLSRAIGDHTYKKNTSISDREQMITALPDVKSVVLDELDEFMVIACDGIWNVMSSQDVVDFVRKRITTGTTQLSLICEEMFDFCLAPDTSGDGTGCDNMTCVIVSFKGLASSVASRAMTGKRKADVNDSTTQTAAKRPKDSSIDGDEAL